MTQGRLEHVNFTVADPQKTAAEFVELFGWRIRWQGEAKDNGHTVHVGEDDTYLAIYGKVPHPQKAGDSYITNGGLNHIGVVVDDLDAVEAKVAAMGYKPHLHGDYEPGRRFYFDNADGIEIEVISYD